MPPPWAPANAAAPVDRALDFLWEKKSVCHGIHLQKRRGKTYVINIITLWLFNIATENHHF